MALALYSEPKEGALISSEDPFTVTFDGRTGGEMDRCVFLRNDNIDRWYSDIVVGLRDDGSIDHTNNSNGWWWKLKRKDIVPTNDEWIRTVAASSLTIDEDIGSEDDGDIVTYIPIWVRVAVPHAQTIQTISSIVFTIEAVEHSVG